jgi:hypothetical protein
MVRNRRDDSEFGRKANPPEVGLAGDGEPGVKNACAFEQGFLHREIFRGLNASGYSVTVTVIVTD